MKAEEMVLDDLSVEDKNIIKEIDEKIKNIKEQISEINKEKYKYNLMIEKIQKIKKNI